VNRDYNKTIERMSGNNKTLNKARKDKIDEFYTLYEDVEKEMKHWKDYFKVFYILW